MTEEIWKRYRPKRLSDVVGQPEAVKALTAMLGAGKVPHALLLCGPSGVGKTTLARILRKKIGCGDADFSEVNCASARGIDTIREIDDVMRMAPITGRCKVFILDEVHRSTGDSMSAMLKLLEDTPKHVYFFLCTTDPQKLLKTIQTRCTTVPLTAVSQGDLIARMAQVLAAEKVKHLGEGVLARIAAAADGSVRLALNILEKVIPAETEEEQLDIADSSDARIQSEFIGRKLMDFRTKWPEVARAIKESDKDPEEIRRGILGYAAAVLLNGSTGKPADRAYAILGALEGNYLDAGVGKAMLVRACYEVLAGK